jgi:hypothetical protein
VIIDSTGFRTALEHQLAIASIEFAVQQYSESRNSPSVDERLQAGDNLFTAAKDAWALLNILKPQLPVLGPVGIG